MNAFVARQCPWPNYVIKKTSKLDCLSAKISASRNIKFVNWGKLHLYITLVFTNLVLKLYKNIQCSFKVVLGKLWAQL